MTEIAWQAMQRTRCECMGSRHYCFLCLESFDPKTANFCSECGWLACPACGGCYCKLTEEGREAVDEFYRIHCEGGNCPYGKGGRPGWELPDVGAIERAIREREEAVKEERDLHDKLSEIRDAIDVIDDFVKDVVPWYYPDHGVAHWERVEQNLQSLIASIGGQSELRGYSLSRQDVLIGKGAAYLHDIGNSVGREGHGRFSYLMLTREDLAEWLAGRGFETGDAAKIANAISKIKRAVPNQIDDIAWICRLHSREDSNQVLRTSDVSEAVDSGLLSEREAALVTLIRIADALDADSRRVETNTEGTPYDSWVSRIEHELSGKKKTETLNHVLGHRSIRTSSLQREEGKLKLSFKINESLLKADPSNVDRAAFKIVDVVKDIDTTLSSCSYNVKLDCEDAQIRRSLSRHIRMQTRKEVE